MTENSSIRAHAHYPEPRIPPTTRLIARYAFPCLLVVLVAGVLWLRLDRAVEAPSELSHGAKKLANQQSDVLLITAATKARAEQQRVLMDPSQDGWASEAMAQKIDDQLTQLAELIITDQITDVELSSLVSDHFQCGRLRPDGLRAEYDDGTTSVLRRHVSDIGNDQPEFAGARGLSDALAKLGMLLRGARHRRFEQKTVHIEAARGTATTRHYIEHSGVTTNGTVEQHATWRCQWDHAADGAPRLNAILVEDYEETISNVPSTTWFRDVTRSAFRNTPAYQRQFAHGLNHWLKRIETTFGMYVFAEYGLAIGDVDGDGLEDIYICQPGGLPNRLLLQNPDGTVSDHTAQANVGWLDHTSSALLADFDNDGDQDLVTANENRRLLLMSNDGAGRFRLVTELLTEDRHVQSLSAVDYDNDGRLDLYITVGFGDHRARPNELRSPFVYHDANEGGANVMFRNESTKDTWQFTDVTRQTGLDSNNRRHSLAASWEDYDNDGDQDLYVANDYGKNCLYRNTRASFEEIAAEASVMDQGSGMSVSWADYDRNGWVDLYVGNMFSSAGRRITSQSGFRQQADDSTRSILARFAKGNSLFRNSVNGFEDVSAPAAVEIGRWAWSSLFADVNNDGWDDLIVANGYITTENSGDL